ncbi:hypothetical protein TCAP_07018 [Tolypocladium capitatum]|uniref:Uncharacterized protein n=1 Tax=Tolypocladium capitatum TaxID=45235 RepID=A0A2K3Q635_9HYPO|nr:hypothetical protein TCAP_07018 [Tolypocladium capitatum]
MVPMTSLLASFLWPPPPYMTDRAPWPSRHSSSSFFLGTDPRLNMPLNSFMAAPNASSPYALSRCDRVWMARTKPSRRWWKSVSRTGEMRKALRHPASCSIASHVCSPSAASSSALRRASFSARISVVASGLIFLTK